MRLALPPEPEPNRGYTWVGATAQQVAIHGVPGLTVGLRDWEGERYGALRDATTSGAQLWRYAREGLARIQPSGLLTHEERCLMPRKHAARYVAGLETTLLEQARRIVGALPGSADQLQARISVRWADMRISKTCIDCHKGIAHNLPKGITEDHQLEGIDF